jgi:hypothetical protein
LRIFLSAGKFTGAAGVFFLRIFLTMSKRSIEELETELHEAKRIAALEAYQKNAISHVDRILAAWKCKLDKATKGRNGGMWTLAIYPAAIAGDRFQLEWAAYTLTHKFTLESYLEAVTQSWDVPQFYSSDQKELLIPDDWKLLRIFGVLFFIYESEKAFELKEPLVHRADPFRPLNGTWLKGLRDLSSSAEIDAAWEALKAEELPEVTDSDELKCLLEEQRILERKIWDMVQKADLVSREVFPYNAL